VIAARSGDRNALGEILRVGYPKLVSFYRAMGLNAADAEDLASEATEGMVRNISGLRDPSSFEAWFWTVARNRFRSALRRRRPAPEELAYGPTADPADTVVARAEHEAVRAALDELSVRDREILWLREVEGLSHDEIATRLLVGAGAVRVAALRARRRLEEAYARHLHE
jgi:RNA polymerase sigma-70 factor (ECF subfamily)